MCWVKAEMEKRNDCNSSPLCGQNLNVAFNFIPIRINIISGLLENHLKL